MLPVASLGPKLAVLRKVLGVRLPDEHESRRRERDLPSLPKRPVVTRRGTGEESAFLGGTVMRASIAGGTLFRGTSDPAQRPAMRFTAERAAAMPRSPRARRTAPLSFERARP